MELTSGGPSDCNQEDGEGDGFTTPSSLHLAIAQSTTSGQNGDLVDVDVTALSTKASGVLVTTVSTAPNEPAHYMPFE